MTRETAGSALPTAGPDPAAPTSSAPAGAVTDNSVPATPPADLFHLTIEGAGYDLDAIASLAFDPDLTPAQLRVVLAVVRLSDAEGYYRGGNRLLARRLDVALGSVARTCAELHRAGWIEHTASGWTLRRDRVMRADRSRDAIRARSRDARGSIASGARIDRVTRSRYLPSVGNGARARRSVAAAAPVMPPLPPHPPDCLHGCDGTGWIDAGGEGRREAAPCPGAPPG